MRNLILGNGHMIKGYSKAGIATSYFLPKYKILIDCGIKMDICKSNINYMLCTHRHLDHSRHIEHYMDQDILTIVTRDHYNQMIKKNDRLLNNSKLRVVDEQMMIPGMISDMIQLNDNLLIEVLKMDHRVESVGYGIIENNCPKILIMGDTTVRPFIVADIWKKYPYIVTECTNYDNCKEKIQNFRAGGHTNWMDILPIIMNNPRNRFILTHSNCAIKYDMMNQLMTNNRLYPNAYFWLDRHIKNV